MAIKKAINLGWGDDSYKLVITMEVIERVDDEVNVLSLVKSISGNNPSIVKVSKLLWVLLDEAGADLTFEEVYNELGSNEKVSSADLFKLAGEIIPMLLPNFAGHQKKTPKRKRKRKK